MSSYVSLNPYGSASIESNIPELAERIFSVNAQPPCTIGLELDIDGDNLNTNNNQLTTQEKTEQTQTVFEILANILLCGIKIKYGEQQDPKRLSEKQIDTIKSYMRSMGFDVFITSFELSDKETIDSYDQLERETYKPTDLEYYRLRMVDEELNFLHDLKIIPYSLSLRPQQQQTTLL